MSEACPTCGQKQRRVRSPADHRRFFASIAAAFHHWPEQHEFQPSSPEELRAWLLCKAGKTKVDVVTIPEDLFDDLPPAAQIVVLNILSRIVRRSIELVKGENEFVFDKIHKDSVVAIFKPLSLSFEAMDQKEFGDLRNDVEAIIEGEIGIKVEDLLKETERAA